ncbi:VRR-NUC domain protein [compost metagenome]
MSKNHRVLEASIEAIVIAFAEERGWFYRKVAWLGRRGAPDRLFARDGRIVFVEFKRPGEEPRLLQKREIARMRAAGIEVHVIDDVDAGMALFV